uniref:Lipocalin-2 1 n=1 Tax=Amblyomma americanum TaxID=6943 RepID=A0A0C9SFA5_AMBAM
MHSFGVAVFLALCATVISAQPSQKDLYEALDTKEKIWTVFRSYELYGPDGKHTCVYAKQQTLSGNDYKFEQGFKDGSKWQNETLYGKLSEQGGEAVLTVSRNPDVGQGIEYTLRYWEEDDHCGILSFTNAENELHCELHIWQGNLPSTGRLCPCELTYDRICSSLRKYLVYTSDCV